MLIYSLRGINGIWIPFNFYPNHIIHANETLLRATQDDIKPVRLEAMYKLGESEVIDNTSLVGSLTPFVSTQGTL